MQHRPWYSSYPPGMPVDAPIEPSLTLNSLVQRSVERYQGKVAFTCESATMTYRELERDSRAFAAFLQSRGMSRGDRIALMLPNGIDYPVALIGAWRAGLTVVSINPLYTASEAAHQLLDSGATALVASATLAPLIGRIAARVPVELTFYAGSGVSETFVDVAPSPGAVWNFHRALAKGVRLSLVEPDIRVTDPACLQYTGGTTGKPKGAALSHGNMVAAVTQMLTWLDSVLTPGNCACITPLPLYHIYPLNCALLMLARGGENRLLPDARALDALLAEMKRAPFTVLLGVNTLFNALLATRRLERADFAGTRLVIGAGATVQESVAERWRDATGVPIREGYGLTECCPCVAFNLPEGPVRAGSIGVPIPSTEVKLIGSGGAVVPTGMTGELCVKGPQVFSGYWNRPDDNLETFTEDGWFRSGDIARFDEDGFLFIVDRLRDMILVSGFNVYPNEIEAVVALLPGVLECACVGVPDARSGEVPHLFIVASDPALQPADVDAHCRTHLAAYKVPRHMTFVDSLPKSAIGKILRKDLRAAQVVSHEAGSLRHLLLPTSSPRGQHGHE